MSTLNVGTIKSLGSSAPVFQNSSGVEKGQLARAWVRFNGTGTVTINDSFNVSSITDNGTGNYNVNFTNAFANANYAYAMGYTAPVNTGQSPQMHTIISSQAANTGSINVAIFHPQQSGSAGRQNDPRISVIIF